MKRVVIIGGGFAGLNAARALGNCRDVHITLIDQRNHHLFQPLLYQVAMAGLSPADIAIPIRSIFSRYKNIRVLQEKINHIDLKNKVIPTSFGQLIYDYLMIATGSKHSYFGHEEWEPNAPGLKSIEQATEIRRRVLSAFENAEKEPDPDRKKQYLTFIVVGGGPTGVELAGAIGEMSRYTLAKDFRNIDPKQTRIILIEAGPRILSSFSESLSSHVVRDLEALGVQVWTSSTVSHIHEDGVNVGKERIQAQTVLWAAGVIASSLGQKLGVPTDKHGKILVQPDLSIKDYPEVFVAGDCGHVENPDEPPMPALAPVAMQQGKSIAKNILADLKNLPRKPFKYLNKGQMATIGRRRAIVQHGRLRLTGWIAWLVWLLVHIYYLVGFRNRILVMLQWSWSYVKFNRGARLIVGKEWQFYKYSKSNKSE